MEDEILAVALAEVLQEEGQPLPLHISAAFDTLGFIHPDSEYNEEDAE